MSATATPIKPKVDAFLQAIDKAMMQFAIELSGKIMRNAPVASGGLSGSFSAGVPQNGKGISVGSPMWDRYGAYVEFGTKPHWMPLQPLIEWVRLTNLYSGVRVSYTESGALKRGRAVRRKDSDIIGIAKAIQRAIAMRGTKPQAYVKQALEEMGVSFVVVPSGKEIKYSVNATTYILANIPKKIQ